MATSRTKAAATGRVKVGGSDAPIVTERALDGAPATTTAPADDEERVTVTIPQAYTLTLDNGQPITYSAGIDEIPRSHADHWYSKVMGVEVYVAKEE